MRSLPEVLESLDSLDKTLERLQRELPPIIRDHEVNSEAKDLAVSHAMSIHQGPEWKARACAYTLCSKEIEQAANTRGRVEAGKTMLKITLGRLDGLRSELSALKSEMEMTRTGYGT